VLLCCPGSLTSHLGERRIQKKREPNVKVAAHLLSSIMYQNKDGLMAGMIVAGWDEREGGQVYTIALGGTMVRQPLAIGGSGSVFIYSLGDAEFVAGMSKDEALAFVRKMVSHAMSRDGSSGGVIRSVVITKEGCEFGFVAGDALPFHLETSAADLATVPASSSSSSAVAASH
jgi:20S proteasome subunit beta 1